MKPFKLITPQISVSGLKIYDPRRKAFVVSDNPALMFASVIALTCVTPFEEGEDFWKFIADMADWCDSQPYFQEKTTVREILQ